MDTVTLGRTGLTVNKNGFGALPIQRVSREEAARLLTRALEGGMTFFDTARAYSDSEEKIGYALSGRLIRDSAAAYAWLAQYPEVLPIWGIQREGELDEFLSYVVRPPVLDLDRTALIHADREELQGSFCRGCGYCMPCPVGIEINNCARMSLMIRRAPKAAQLTEAMQAKMAKIADCLHCGQCAAKCPYGLDTPKLLEENYKDYQEILAGKPV